MSDVLAEKYDLAMAALDTWRQRAEKAEAAGKLVDQTLDQLETAHEKLRDDRDRLSREVEIFNQREKLYDFMAKKNDEMAEEIREYYRRSDDDDQAFAGVDKLLKTAEAKLAIAVKALEECASCHGAFDPDQFKHACNTIDMVEDTARRALEQIQAKDQA